MLAYRCGLKLKGYTPKALNIGSIYHTMMQNLALGLDIKDALVEAHTSVAKQKAIIAKDANEQGVLPNGKTLELYDNSMEEAYSFAQMLFMITAKPFFLEFGEIAKGNWIPLLVENAVQTKLEGFKSPLRCKVDLLLATKNNEVVVVDYKTTGKEISKVAASYRWNIQVLLTAYIISAHYAQAGLTLKGFLHNVIRKPTIKYPTRNSPTMDIYIENCKKWYDEKQIENPDEPTMARSMVSCNGAITQEFHNTLTLMDNACSGDLDPDLYPRIDSKCMGLYGNSPCPYLQLCQSGASLWPTIIKNQYTQEFREAEEESELLEND